jgi:hypothetical protein
MTVLVVEDGTMIVGANTYISAIDFVTFASARNYTPVLASDILLIQAMDYIESLGFKGLKRNRDQALQWPRAYVYIDGYYVDVTHIPQQLKDGLCHVAIAIDQNNGPDADVPRFTDSERVGDLEVRYSKGAPSTTINIKLRNALYKLLANGGASGLVVNKA